MTHVTSLGNGAGQRLSEAEKGGGRGKMHPFARNGLSLFARNASKAIQL